MRDSGYNASEYIESWFGIGLKEKPHEAETIREYALLLQLPKLPDKKSRAPGDGTQASGPNGNGEERPWRPARRTRHSIKPREPDLLLVVERTQEPQERWPDG